MRTFPIPERSPRRITVSTCGVPVLLLLLLLGLATAQANPKIRTQFFNNYPSALGSKIATLPSNPNHCGACHWDFNGGGTRNPYGLTVQNALPNYPNTDAGKSNAIYSVRLQDADADGFSALLEITGTNFYPNIPTFPGLTPANVSQVLNVTVSEIQTNLVPSAGGDTTPPSLVLTRPNGGEVFIGNRPTNITWTASDPSGVASINIHVSIDNGLTYEPVALGLANTGSYTWFPANRPVTNLARIKIIAVDNASNSTNKISAVAFSIFSPPGGRVPTTLRDFDMPGTQPHQGGNEIASPADCAQCHGNYSATVEPYHNWQGSMMAHASIDPLFEANMVIANQDAPDSGDLCLRCHFSRGWLQGRSVPTDGSRMVAADHVGVSCELCHRMVDPVFAAGVSPAIDSNILAALTFRGTNYGNGMYVIDPNAIQRGPFTNPVAPHSFYASPFHRSAAFCGTCHDVSNPAFTKDEQGIYQPNTLNVSSTTFSPHHIGPVERTYSEWLASDYNSPTGVYAPQFAGNKTNGMVSTCQDCHMRDVSGYGANTNLNAGVPLRADLPLHDMTGGSTWLPGLLTNLYPGQVNPAAIQAGIARATYLLQNAASLSVADASSQLKVTVTNECGHKLPTGYPEGRRVWLNVKFYDEAMNFLGESGAYNSTNGVLSHDAEAKIYEVHPGIDTNISGLVSIPTGPSLHFVLNNKIYEDNRIPPRGFTNAAFAEFGGAPVGYSYADGQYWDDTLYTLPAGAARAEVRLYYQSTSKEFIEFLRDENTTNTKGQELYDLWNNNGKCPPTLMGETTWVTAFGMKSAQFTAQGKFRMEFLSRPGLSYTIEFRDLLTAGSWQTFMANGTFTATNTLSSFEDDFTANSSGGPSPTGQRYYRFKYSAP